MNYCRIFCELADAFIPVMTEETKLGNAHFSIKTLDLILICVGHHEYEVNYELMMRFNCHVHI